MAAAILLSAETWKRIEKMLDDYEKGLLHVIPGDGLKLDEVGPDGTVIAVDGTTC